MYAYAKGTKIFPAKMNILYYMVNVLKFQTLVACQKGKDKQGRPRSDCFCFWRSSLIRVFPVCYSYKQFVNFSPENHHFIWEQKEKSVWNIRTFNIIWSLISCLMVGGKLEIHWCRKEIAFKQRLEISNNVVCATSKGSDQPAHMHSLILIRAFASRLILWILSYWLNII